MAKSTHKPGCSAGEARNSKKPHQIKVVKVSRNLLGEMQRVVVASYPKSQIEAAYQQLDRLNLAAGPSSYYEI